MCIQFLFSIGAIIFYVRKKGNKIFVRAKQLKSFVDFSIGTVLEVVLKQLTAGLPLDGTSLGSAR